MKKRKLSTLVGFLASGAAALAMLLMLTWALDSSPVAAATADLAACPTEIFISEYIEGSSYNKALEIYNGTGSDVMLTDHYTLFISFNGGSSERTIDLSGTVSAGDVFVLADDDATQAILDQADQTASGSFYNGDDAIVLYHDGAVVDVIGQVGSDPGDEWGSGDASTQDNTLVRQSSVMGGDTDGGDAFDPAAEWDGYAQDTFTHLGSHTLDPCGGAFEIAKDAPSMVSPGDVFTYTIVVTNGTGVTTTATVVTDVVPANAEFSSASHGGVLVAGTTVSWTIGGDFPAGQAISRTFRVTAASSPGAQILNGDYAVWAADWITPTAGSPVTTTVTPLDLAVAKTGPHYAVVGGNLVYTLTLRNQGVVSAGNVFLTDTLPLSTTYVADGSPWTAHTSTPGARQVVTWFVGDVPSNTVHTFNLTATVDVSVTGGTVLTNDLAAGTGTAGDDPANNAARWEATAYPLVTVQQIQHVPQPATEDDSPLLNRTVWVEGIVTAEPGDIDEPSRILVIEDPAGGPWSGLPVYKGSAFPGLAAPRGSAVRLLGTVDEFYGLTQLEVDGSPAAFQILSAGNPIPGPDVISTTAFDDSDAATSEQWEGVLLEFRDATVITDALGFGEWAFDDGSGPSRADDLGEEDGDLTYEPTNGDDYLFLRGIGWYSFGNYKLEPRDDRDVGLRATVPTLAKDAPALVAPGERLTYTLVVTNELGFTLNDVLITDVVPAGATFAYALDGGAEESGVVSWTVPSLANLASVTVRFAVTAPGGSALLLNDDYTVVASNFVTPTFGPPVGTVVSTGTLRIRDIQGAAHRSPLNGQQVKDVHGIVTLLASNGFYVQDPNPDGDVATSEGIFVFGGGAPGVAVGDEVLVSGRVDEFYNAGSEGLSTTRIDLRGTPTVSSTGNPLPSPIVIGAPGRVPPTEVIDDDAGGGSVETSGTFDPLTDGIDFYESLEGMLVQLNDAMAVGPTDDRAIPVVGDGGEHATLVAGRNGVTAGIVIREGDFNPERLMVANANLPAPPDVDVGARFPGAITGTLDYDDVQTGGNFYLLNANPLSATASGLISETTSLAASDSQLTVASFNVYNLDPGDTAEKFAGLAGQIVDHLGAPDILGLQEIQDNSGAADDGTVDAGLTWSTLITAIQDAGGPLYQYRDVAPEDNQDGGAPGGNIRVGFLYRPDRVTLVERGVATATTATTPTTTTSGVELTFSPGRVAPTSPAFVDSRKPLAAEFLFNGHRIFIVVSHFSSKSGDAPLFGNVQPPPLASELERVPQAQAVNDFVDAILALDADANVIVLGDLNDFQFSQAVSDTLAADALTNLVHTLPITQQYTYIFEGNSQVLDHVLVSRHLLDHAAPLFDAVHVNAEFVRDVGDSSRRASDHDPVLARLHLPPKIYLPLVMRGG